MKNLVEAKGAVLFWEQPKAFQSRFLLIAGDDIYGELDFSSGFSTSAQAVSIEDRWIYKRVGLLSTRVIIRRAGSESDLAVYSPRWSGTAGEIRFTTGEQYQWRVDNFWASKYVLSGDDGLVMITYLSGSRDRKLSNIFKQQAQVVIASEAWQLSYLPILISLGWYLVILHIEDSSAVAVTASTAVLN